MAQNIKLQSTKEVEVSRDGLKNAYNVIAPKQPPGTLWYNRLILR